MNKAPFTPGPWFYDGANKQEAHIIHVAEGEIAEAFADTFPEGQAHANACLIAEAPNLLEILQAIIGIDPWARGSYARFKELQDRAREAVAKAKGEFA